MRSVKGAKIFGSFLIFVFAAAVAMWFVTVSSERERYLTSRNFRLLASIATQLDTSIDTQERTFQTLLTSARPVDAHDPLGWYHDSAQYIPSLQALDRDRLPERFTSKTSTATRFKSTTGIGIDDRKTWFHLSIARNDTPEVRQAFLDVGQLLAPMFGPKLRDEAFDTLLLASADGQVLYAEGARSAELGHSHLDNLSAPRPLIQLFGQGTTPSSQGVQPGFASVARTNGSIDVIVSGTEYKLFSQPCPPGIRLENAKNGVVLVGLVDAAVFRAKARQFPTTLVFVFSALILLAFTGWPFLRMRFIGERQRVRRIEVVQVIASALFGVALLTVCCMDWFAYWHLNQVRDAQLKTLADKIGEHASAELDHANRQLQTLTTVALQCATSLNGQAKQTESADVRGLRSIFTEQASTTLLKQCGVPAGGQGWPGQWDKDTIAEQPYPRFKTMALVDSKGFQYIKWTSRNWQPAPISVAGRPYFKNANDRHLWQRDADSPHPQSDNSGPADSSYTLESIWSWTTAEPEAVLAIATDQPKYPVATLTIPMTSLIDPVVPAGVEFAIIDEDGAVLFHSDPQRNTHENLFEESDQNRRLRAAVAARITEHVDLQYAGRSYRSYIGRFGAGTPWAIVTLSNNEPMWGLHTEWVVLSLVALVIFMAFLVGVFALCFFTGHSDWLWADIGHVGRYRVLSAVVLTLLVASLAILWRGENRTVMVWSVALPLLAWAIAYITTSRSPRTTDAVGDAHPEWGSLAVLLFLLTGIIPAAGFLISAYRVDVRADVRHVQLQLASRIARHDDHATDTADEYPGVPPRALAASIERPDYALYITPWSSESSRYQPPGGLPAVRVVTEARKPARDSAPDVFGEIAEIVAEEYLPYYSERSVQIRELLLHNRAHDDSWWWTGENLTFTRPDAAPAIEIAAAAPRLGDALLEATSIVPGVLVVVGALGLVTLAWCGVWFIETHVCLRDVREPLWPKAESRGTRGKNLWVHCPPKVCNELAQASFDLRRESDKWSVPDDVLLARLLKWDETATGWPVLFPDFDEHVNDPARAARQFAWIEQMAADDTRSVVVVSAHPPLIDDRGGDDPLASRWRTVLQSFVVLDWTKAVPPGGRTWAQTWLKTIRSEPPALSLDGVWGLIGVRKHEVALAALTRESSADAFVRAICASIESGLSWTPEAPADTKPATPPPDTDKAATVRMTSVAKASASTQLRLSPEQMLDEIADRTDAWYGHIWRSCTPDEKLVLAEIALEGFVNYKSRRTVRRLLGRRLVTKKPNFRLMNETFRRFVLSPPCQSDVKAIEGTSEPSPWDRWRIPFFTILVAASLFFLVTQRELFNATIATLSTLAAAVPVIVRVAGLVAGKPAQAEVKS